MKAHTLLHTHTWLLLIWCFDLHVSFINIVGPKTKFVMYRKNLHQKQYLLWNIQFKMDLIMHSKSTNAHDMGYTMGIWYGDPWCMTLYIVAREYVFFFILLFDCPNSMCPFWNYLDGMCLTIGRIKWLDKVFVANS